MQGYLGAVNGQHSQKSSGQKSQPNHKGAREKRKKYTEKGMYTK